MRTGIGAASRELTTRPGPQLSLERPDSHEAPRRLSEFPDGAAVLGKRLQSTGATHAATSRAPGHRPRRGRPAQAGAGPAPALPGPGCAADCGCEQRPGAVSPAPPPVTWPRRRPVSYCPCCASSESPRAKGAWRGRPCAAGTTMASCLAAGLFAVDGARNRGKHAPGSRSRSACTGPPPTSRHRHTLHSEPGTGPRQDGTRRADPRTPRGARVTPNKLSPQSTGTLL